MGYFGKIIKGALILGTVGALLALSVHFLLPVAVTMGLSESLAATVGASASASAAWGAVFFGAFGAINAAVEPVINGIFSFGSHSQTGGHRTVQTAHYSHSVSPDVAPALTQPELVVDNSRKFQDMVQASKAPASFQEKLATDRSEPPEHTI